MNLSACGLNLMKTEKEVYSTVQKNDPAFDQQQNKSLLFDF